MILVKPGAIFQAMTPALIRMLGALESVMMEGRALVPGMPADLVITSVNDSKHLPTSRHYRDEALDLRSHAFPNQGSKDTFRMTVQARLGPKFAVLFEDKDTDNEHFHIQVRKGGTYP
jgi:hypothetical protein